MKKSYRYTIHIKPNAKANKIIAYQGDQLKIAIKAPPVDGKANKELIVFLAEHLHIPKNCIEIIRGKGSPIKQIVIQSDTDLFLALQE